MKKIRPGLTPKVLLIGGFMLAGLAGILVMLSLRQQQELILEYSMRALESKLEPVETKTEEIRFYSQQIKKLQKARQYYKDTDGKLSRFFSSDRYLSLEDSLRNGLSASGQSNITDYTWKQLVYLSGRLSQADRAVQAAGSPEEVKEIIKNYTFIGRSLDSIILNQTGYRSVLRSQFSGLDSGYRIQTVGLYFHAYFDTTILEPGRDLDYKIQQIYAELRQAGLSEERKTALYTSLSQLRQQRARMYSVENRKVNLLNVGTDPEIIQTLDSVRDLYYQKTPALSARHHQYSPPTDPAQYLISVRTLYMNPSVSERAKLILEALESAENRPVWLRYLSKDRQIAEEIRKTGKKLTEHRNSHESISAYRNDPVTKDLILQYNSLRKERTDAVKEARQAAAGSDAVTAESLKKEIERLEARKSQTEEKLKELNEQFRSLTQAEQTEEVKLKEQNLDFEIQEEENRLSELNRQIPRLQNQKEQLFTNSDRIADAFLYLRDAMVFSDAFLEISYDDQAYFTYTTAKNLRSDQQNRWQSLRKWVMAACSETDSCQGVYLPALSSGKLLLPRRIIEDKMISYDSASADELAGLALFENTAAYTRVFMDRSAVDRELNQERDQLLDMAISIGIRMLIIALLVSLFFVRRIKRITEGAREVGSGNFKTRFDTGGSDELAELSRTLNRMTSDLKHRESMLNELSAAQQIQNGLLPESIPESFTDILSFGTLYRASSGVGGDYFDFIPVDEDRFLFCIADVTGHGPGPAMIMAMMRSHLHSLVQTGHTSAAGILTQLNDRLYQETPATVFITVFLGIYERNTHTISYCSAGHNKSLIYRYEKETVEEMKAGGLPLGLEEKEIFNTVLEPGKIQLAKGDMFFQYTDGINEAANDNGEQFSVKRLQKILQLLGRKKPRTILDNLLSQIEQYTGRKVQTEGPTELADDIAVILFRRIK